ncbi:MAG: CPBP family glutamic-type intramembrane protease, partial [Candidatus Asgardarchaeia archaeon]
QHIKKDKALIIMLLIAIPSIIYFGLSSALYFLGYSVLTLSIIMIIGLLFSREYIYEKDVGYGILVLIPIAMRLFVTHFNFIGSMYNIFDVINLMYNDFYYGFQVIGLLSIIALSEESFRGAIITLLNYLIPTDDELRQFAVISIANILWLVLHFIQRPFSLTSTSILYYVIWLLITGYILSIILIKSGLGTAVLCHFLINLTG